jgi:hypothetical protein
VVVAISSSLPAQPALWVESNGWDVAADEDNPRGGSGNNHASSLVKDEEISRERRDEP